MADDFLSAGTYNATLDTLESRTRDNRSGLQKFGDFKRSLPMATCLFIFGIVMVVTSLLGMFSDVMYMVIQKSHLIILFNLVAIFLAFPAARYFWFAHFKDHLFATPFCDSNAPKKLVERGNIVLGKSRTNHVIITLNKLMMMTHILIFGGTGSGKSETIFTLLINAIMSGSGGVLCDGKADASLAHKTYGLARRFGRDADMLFLSYIMGSKGQRKMRTPIARSNKMNPLAKGSASFCSEFTISLMTTSDGDNAIFSKRAVAFVKAYMRIMEYLRDTGRMNPFIGDFADDISTLDRLAVLCADKEIPMGVRKPLRDYMITTSGTLASYIEAVEKGGQLPRLDPQAIQQHGYVSMQLIEPLSILGQDYGHIFNVLEYDIDMFDVMVNRRILITLIPALEMSQDSLQGLGKVVIASMKSLLTEIMDGGNLTGTIENILEKRPTNSPMFFPAILDEVGYYMVPGIAVIPAQARSLGVGFVFAGQDKPAFTKLVDTEADSIIANTLVKMTGILEDSDTGEIFTKRAGKTYVAETSGSSNQNSSTGNHQDKGETNVKEVDRLDIRDLYRQKSGEFLIMNKDKFDFVSMMYTGVLKPTKNLQINQKVPMPPLKEEWLLSLFSSAKASTEARQKPRDMNAINESIEPLPCVFSDQFDVMAMCLRHPKNLQGIYAGLTTLNQNDESNGSGDSFSNPESDQETNMFDKVKIKNGVPVGIDESDIQSSDQHIKPVGNTILEQEDIHIDIFNYMDEMDVTSAMQELSCEMPNASDDSERIVEMAKITTRYPSHSPFKDGQGGGSKTSMLDSLMSELKERSAVHSDKKKDKPVATTINDAHVIPDLDSQGNPENVALRMARFANANAEDITEEDDEEDWEDDYEED